jgi:hypothetical protein
MTDDLVERMHARLVDALRRLRPDPFGSPVTVAEIYQDLVPYRNVRTELGFDMNADYEHTLLRLLAGEGELARLDPAEARDELRAELESSNPNVGLFRKFAACDVWITRTVDTAAATRPPAEAAGGESWDPRGVRWEEEDAGLDAGIVLPTEAPGPAAAPPEARWTEERAETELLLEEAFEVLEEPPRAAAVEAIKQPHAEGGPMEAAPPPERAAGSMPAALDAAVCPFCDSNLPARRPVRFCPYCGADQSTTPCVACSEPIEAGWKFCVTCGAEAPDQERA